MVPLLSTLSDATAAEAGASTGFRVVYGGQQMTPYLVQQALLEDLNYAIFSCLLVFVYTVWHTKSVLLAISSLMMICLTFPVCFFFYFEFCTVDGSTSLGLLNVLGVYVILGIGVDDVYVFLAAFEQCAVGAVSVEQQLGRAFSRAAKAMLTTSATTAFAFLSNQVSSIPVILSFSRFMAILVILNYIFVITIFPAMLMVLHTHIWPRACTCCKRRAQIATMSDREQSPLPQQPQLMPPDLNSGDTDHWSNPVSRGGGGSEGFTVGGSGGGSSGSIPEWSEPGGSPAIQDNLPRRGGARAGACWEAFARQSVQHPKPVVVCAVIVWLMAVFWAAKLRPSVKLPELFEEGENVQQFLVRSPNTRPTSWTNRLCCNAAVASSALSCVCVPAREKALKNVNLTSSSHCDTCGALYMPQFRCDGIRCAEGTSCRYGLCYSPSGTLATQCMGQITQISTACTLAALSSADFATSMQIAAGGGLVALLGLDAHDAPDTQQLNCVDQYRDCAAWKAERQCDTNAGFMHAACRYSCGACSTSSYQTETGLECFDQQDNNHDGVTDCDDITCESTIPFWCVKQISKRTVAGCDSNNSTFAEKLVICLFAVG